MQYVPGGTHSPSPLIRRLSCLINRNNFVIVYRGSINNTVMDVTGRVRIIQ